MHLARRGEDALDAGGGSGRSEVLLDHFRERLPHGLLHLPPRKHVHNSMSGSSGSARYRQGTCTALFAFSFGFAFAMLTSRPASQEEAALPVQIPGRVANSRLGVHSSCSRFPTGMAVGLARFALQRATGIQPQIPTYRLPLKSEVNQFHFMDVSVTCWVPNAS